MWKPALTTTLLAGALLGLGGCAAMNAVDSNVSTYSQWPAGRSASTYAFERLPSQQARAMEQEKLESMARHSLQVAGFSEAGDAKAADFTVQVGARINRYDVSPYDDPFWWHGGLFRSRYGYGGYGRGPFWGPPGYFGPRYYDTTYYDREVAVLIRDRQSGQVVYEARAANDGTTMGGDAMIAAMFDAALKDFPQTGINPRRVTIQLPPS
jgi:hypothetical protein